MNYFWVFIGGGIGSVLRFGISEMLKSWSQNFPYATLIANSLSCILLGIVVGLFANDSISPSHRLLLATGVCGGFSTFSTFTNETFQLFQAGNIFLAVGNIFFNLALCFLCLFIGLKISN
jgi:fluoride exporter